MGFERMIRWTTTSGFTASSSSTVMASMWMEMFASTPARATGRCCDRGSHPSRGLEGQTHAVSQSVSTTTPTLPKIRTRSAQTRHQESALTHQQSASQERQTYTIRIGRFHETWNGGQLSAERCRTTYTHYSTISAVIRR